MKTFGYLLMAVMACMTCSCRDEEPLPDPVPPVMEPENPGNPEEPDTGKVYLGIAPIIENMQEQRAVVENWKEGHCLGVTAAGDVNIPFTFDGRRWKAEKQVEVTAEQKVSAYYPYNVQYTDMTAIPVDITTQEDYMYGEGGVSVEKPSAVLVMKHALSLVRILIKKNDYTGDGMVDAVTFGGVRLSASIIKNPTEKVQLMAVHDSPANILRIKNPSRQACLSCLGSVMPGGTAGIHFKEDISEAVKNLFTRLGEIEERYGELMRDAGHMDTYDARYEATEKAEAYRTRKISAAVGTFRKEAVLETSAVPEKTVVVEKTEATEAQPSSGEMRFKGGRRELTIRNGSAVLRTNGESFDATDILKDMRAHGVDIGRVSGKAMSEMLKGNKTALPGASGNSVFAIVKGPAGYGLKAFQIAKQVHSAAAQEI